MIISREKEFAYTESDFQWIRTAVHKRVGISLNESKREMVYARVARRIRALNLKDFRSYRKILENTNSNELVEFVNAITTNVTAFFRENHHFEALANEFFPEIIKRNYSSKKIRIWSAGCSSGEEPYSIAITVKENIPESWDVKIIATDLDTNVLEKAKKGVYSIDAVSSIPKSRLKQWFWRGKGSNDSLVKVVPELQNIIDFKQLNLMGDWPHKGQFDIIFCRNVVIYFDKPTQRVLFDRYADILKDHGILFLGHSESLHGVSDRFQFIRQTMHRKVR
mgnify:CR=1 FL=1